MKRSKILAAVLASLLVLSACSSNAPKNTAQTQSNTSAATDAESAGDSAETGENAAADNQELIEITFVKEVDDTLENNVLTKLPGETLEDNRWTKIIAEELGYKITYKWVVRDNEQYKQKFNAALASGDIPDIIFVDNVQMKQAIESDLLADIGGVFDQHASPLLKEIIAGGGDAPVQAAVVDDVQYAVPIIDADIEKSSLLYLRTDWLEQTGKQAPKTIDELVALAQDFKGIAGAEGKGLGVEKLTFGRGGAFKLEGFFNAYGAYPEYWINDGGSLVYGNTTPEFKTALAKLAEMFQAGLIDREFTVKDGGKVAEDIVAGNIGMYYGPHWTPLWPQQDCVNNDPNADWKPFPIPTVDGSDPHPGVEMATVNWYAASAGSEHPEALVRIMNLYCDLTFDPEKQQYEYYSNPPSSEGTNIEGVWKLCPVYQYKNNKNVNTTREIRSHLESGDPGELYGESLSMFNFALAGQNGDIANWSWNRVFGIDGACDLQGQYLDKSLPYLNPFFGAPTDTMVTNKTILDNAFNEAIIKVISGQQSLDEFDLAIKAWFDGGGTKITQEVNEWYKDNQ